MLHPRDRRLLLGALRPPTGYELDCAIGTTFSLDLLALLTTPLAFTFFDLETQDGRPTADPLALLEAVRRHADRITIFCHAGRISVPAKHRLLFGYLEELVIEVMPPKSQKAFHPKVWVLRFVVPDEPVRYRLLCLSRNLTFDRSWDTILVLDGELTDRVYAFGDNHPLGDFVAALPDMALRQPRDEVLDRIDLLQYEVRRVRFELPPEFEEVTFWPLGLTRRRTWPFTGRTDRVLVISPFVSEGTLSRLVEGCEERILISRLESLDAADPACLDRFDNVYVLSPAANVEERDDPDEDSGGEPTLTGLHAKVYVADAGWDARVWTGSANATDAAFNGNVEFLVELRGKKSRCGVDALLARGEDGFIGLLESYTPDLEEEPVDEVQRELEARLEDARRVLAASGLVARATWADEEQEFQLVIESQEGKTLDLPQGVRARCWPISLAEQKGVDIETGGHTVADLGRVSFEALTSFFAFHLKVTSEGRAASIRFVLNLPLRGAPDGRQEGILRSLLQSRQRVLRLLLLLLAEDVWDMRDVVTVGGSDSTWRDGGEVPLFEKMMKALDRDPRKLEQIAGLVATLREGPEGEDLLPEGFEGVWQPIWTVAQARLQNG